MASLRAGDENLGSFNFNGASSGSTAYTLNLTPELTTDLQGGNLISLRMAAADSVVSYLFNSRDFGAAASRPLLTITAIPESGCLVLFSSSLAIAAIAGFQSRHSALITHAAAF